MFDRSISLKTYYIITYQTFKSYQTAAFYENNLRNVYMQKMRSMKLRTKNAARDCLRHNTLIHIYPRIGMRKRVCSFTLIKMHTIPEIIKV